MHLEMKHGLLLIITLLSNWACIDGLLSNQCKEEMAAKSKIQSIMNRDIAGARIESDACMLVLFVYNKAGDELTFLWNSCTKNNLTVISYTPLSLSKHSISIEMKDMQSALEYLGYDCLNSFKSIDLDLTTMTGLSSSQLNQIDDKVTKKRVKRQVLQGLYPGTKYCGKGSSAEVFGDVGEDAADICCRAHDACKLWIGASQTRYGFTNNNTYIVMVHCHCDKQFHWCLERTQRVFKSQTSAMKIHSVFFQTLDMRCFLFVKGPICTKTEQKCTAGWIGQTCEKVCVDYRYGYRAIEAKIQQGDIVPIKDIQSP